MRAPLVPADVDGPTLAKLCERLEYICRSTFPLLRRRPCFVKYWTLLRMRARCGVLNASVLWLTGAKSVESAGKRRIEPRTDSVGYARQTIGFGWRIAHLKPSMD